MISSINNEIYVTISFEYRTTMSYFKQFRNKIKISEPDYYGYGGGTQYIETKILGWTVRVIKYFYKCFYKKTLYLKYVCSLNTTYFYYEPKK